MSLKNISCSVVEFSILHFEVLQQQISGNYFAISKFCHFKSILVSKTLALNMKQFVDRDKFGFPLGITTILINKF